MPIVQWVRPRERYYEIAPLRAHTRDEPLFEARRPRQVRQGQARRPNIARAREPREVESTRKAVCKSEPGMLPGKIPRETIRMLPGQRVPNPQTSELRTNRTNWCSTRSRRSRSRRAPKGPLGGCAQPTRHQSQASTNRGEDSAGALYSALSGAPARPAWTWPRVKDRGLQIHPAE